MYSNRSSQSLPMSLDSEINDLETTTFMTTDNPVPRVGLKDGLRSIEEIPPKFRHVFQYPYFNKMQSQLIDDVLYSDKSMVVSAPTGSGKTVIFELAIVRLIQQLEKMKSNNDFKIIYMAPMRALCTERLTDWYGKFTKLGLQCIEVTGDSDSIDFNHLKSYKMIMTTPEKWDAMTRRWKDNKEMVQVIKLFIIDEVHLLNEDVRGPVLEAVVSRMKTIQESFCTSVYVNNKNITQKNDIDIRFIAASATIPNAEDVAEWLGTKENPAICYKIGEEFRPVKLVKIVEGYPCRDGHGLFKFDLFLNYKLKHIIERYCAGKPTLIFCNTRKSVMLAAETLSKELLFHFTEAQKSRFIQMASQLSEKKLQTLVIAGIGCHHAGFIHRDRNIIEQIFKEGNLPVLITTSTLATGVNLPAHLVIIKTTQHYVNGAYTEYEESSILQMMGRAGRPQFDTEGIAVIMTRIQDKERYEKLCSGQRAVESKLHRHLAEHLNAEVALGTLPDLLLAMDWLRSTFLYVRATRNPSHYGCSKVAGREVIEKKLQEICIKWMNALARAGLLTMDADTRVFPTEAGILMASYCLDFDTMKLILKLRGTEDLNELVTIISECHEFEDIALRASEKRCLNMLNKNAQYPSCRFPIPGKIKTKHMKANCLIQAVLGNLPILDSSLNQESIRIMKTGENITKCIVSYLSHSIAKDKQVFKALLNSVTLAKCFSAKMWDNSDYVSRQLTGIGPALASLLVAAEKTSFEKIKSNNPRDLERILNKGPPAGNVLKKQVTLLPVYVINLETIPDKNISVDVSILNFEDIRLNGSTTGNSHKLTLIVGDSENNVLYSSIIVDIHILNMTNATINKKIKLKCSTPHIVYAHCISNTWVGLDVQSNLEIHDPLFIRDNYMNNFNECDVIKSSQATETVTKTKNKPTPKKKTTTKKAHIETKKVTALKEQINTIMNKIKPSSTFELPCDQIPNKLSFRNVKNDNNDLKINEKKSGKRNKIIDTPFKTSNNYQNETDLDDPDYNNILSYGNNMSIINNLIKTQNQSIELIDDNNENITNTYEKKNLSQTINVDDDEIMSAVAFNQRMKVCDKFKQFSKKHDLFFYDVTNDHVDNIENEYRTEVKDIQKNISIVTDEKYYNNNKNRDEKDNVTKNKVISITKDTRMDVQSDIKKIICLLDNSNNETFLKERMFQLVLVSVNNQTIHNFKGTFSSINCKLLHRNQYKHCNQILYSYAYQNIAKLQFEFDLFNIMKKYLINIKIRKPLKIYSEMKKKIITKKKTLRNVTWKDPLITSTIEKNININIPIVIPTIECNVEKAKINEDDSIKFDDVVSELNLTMTNLESQKKSVTPKEDSERKIINPFYKYDDILKWLRTSSFECVDDLYNNCPQKVQISHPVLSEIQPPIVEEHTTSMLIAETLQKHAEEFKNIHHKTFINTSIPKTQDKYYDMDHVYELQNDDINRNTSIRSLWNTSLPISQKIIHTENHQNQNFIEELNDYQYDTYNNIEYDHEDDDDHRMMLTDENILDPQWVLKNSYNNYKENLPIHKTPSSLPTKPKISNIFPNLDFEQNRNRSLYDPNAIYNNANRISNINSQYSTNDDITRNSIKRYSFNDESKNKIFLNYNSQVNNHVEMPSPKENLFISRAHSKRAYLKNLEHASQTSPMISNFLKQFNSGTKNKLPPKRNYF